MNKKKKIVEEKIENYFNCKEGDIFLLRKNRKKKDLYIAYDRKGRIIIPINKTIGQGYGRITKIVKRSERYTLVEMENKIIDYYDGIKYKDFIEVLKVNKFNIGFNREFIYKTKEEERKEHQILAYRKDKGIIIVAETFNKGRIFNSIKVYCPNLNMRSYLKCPILSMAGENMTVMDLCYNHNNKIEFPLRGLIELITDNKWDKEEYINLWTYADYELDKIENNKYERHSNLWNNTIERILLAPKEIEDILGECISLKEIFKNRK